MQISVVSGEDKVDAFPAQAPLKTGALQDAIFNSAYFSSIATDAKGVIQIFNVGAERMLGYAAADVMNKITPADISDPEELIARATALSAELATVITPGFEALVFKASRGIEDIYELTYVRKDGSRFPAMVSVTALRDAGGAIIGYLLIGTDNTARKQAEAALANASALQSAILENKNIELEHASRMKSEFLATMSHELRTPLNAIIGFSEALRDGLMGEMNATQLDYIGDIFSSGQHLLSLINDILDLSKVEAGMMTLELEPVDMKSLLFNSLSIVKEKAASQRVRLVLEMGEDLGVPLLDLRKTKQIVYNLLANAVKFSKNGGCVTLHARHVPRSSVGTLPGPWPVYSFPFGESDCDVFLEISVSDGGIGISSENMSKLFLAFSQIDSTLARRFQGTGLGLAMVKQLAELHGGTVAVASAEGEGARFAAWLPLRMPAHAAPSQTLGLGDVSTAAAGNVASESIQRVALVVEDNDQSAELVRLLLESEGFKVLRAASAEAALPMAQQQALSLITLDIRLPGMNGWEFLEQLRENDELARVPVVIITGLAERNLGLTRGATCVLQKPISRAHFRRSLSELGLNAIHDRICTVLVVDDDPKAVEIIAAFLPASAYAVVRAYGGAEAITLAQRLIPDLILLDLMMPEVNGFDVVDALQRHVDTAAIPILVVTAKHITELDRAELNKNPAKIVNIVDKGGFNTVRFLAEVRRALHPR